MTISKQEFLRQCTEFENLMRHKYKLQENESPYYEFAHLPEFKEYIDDINVIRILRNTYVHNNTLINGEEAFEIKPVIENALNEIMEKLKNPPIVQSIYTSKVISAKPNDRVWTTMYTMKEKGISYVPVLENKHVIGVFSKTTIFDALIDHTVIKKNETIGDLLRFLPNDSVSYQEYDFIGIHDSIEHARQMFMKLRKKPLELLFVTQNGSKNEPLIGVLSPYDLLKDRSEDQI